MAIFTIGSIGYYNLDKVVIIEKAAAIEPNNTLQTPQKDMAGKKKPAAVNMYKQWGWDYKSVFTDSKSWPLIEAIEREDAAAIRQMAKSGQADVNVLGEDDVTPLAWSLLSSDEVFLALLELGADPNVVFLQNKHMAFVIANQKVTNPKLECYRYNELALGTVLTNLLRPRFPRTIFEMRNPGQPYPKEEARIEAVLKHGANPNYSIGYYKPIQLATQGDNVCQKIKLLVKYGAEIKNISKSKGISATVLSTLCSDAMRTPSDDRFNAIVFLLQNKVDLRPSTNYDMTVISAMISMKYAYNLNAEYPQYDEMEKLLKSQGVDIGEILTDWNFTGAILLQRISYHVREEFNSKVPEESYTSRTSQKKDNITNAVEVDRPQQAPSKNAENRKPAAVNMYKQWGWDYKSVFTDSKSWPLIEAIEREDAAAIRQMAKSGQADVNVLGEDDVTPLAWSLLSSDEVFLALLELGADPNVVFLQNKHMAFVIANQKVTNPKLECYRYNELALGTVLTNLLRPRFPRTIFEMRNPGQPYPKEEARIEAVLKHGANPNYSIGYYKPIQLATQGDNVCQKIKLLVKYGAEIENLSDIRYETVLSTLLTDAMRTPSDDRFNAIVFLLQNKVDLRPSTDYDMTVINAMIRMKYAYNLNAEYPQYDEMEKLLKSQGVDIGEILTELNIALPTIDRRHRYNGNGKFTQYIDILDNIGSHIN